MILSTFNLITSDNASIQVDGTFLAAHSAVFADMFKLPPSSNGGNECQVTESKNEMELMMEALSLEPAEVDRKEYGLDKLRILARLCDKYGIKMLAYIFQCRLMVYLKELPLDVYCLARQSGANRLACIAADLTQHVNIQDSGCRFIPIHFRSLADEQKVELIAHQSKLQEYAMKLLLARRDGVQRQCAIYWHNIAFQAVQNLIDPNKYELNPVVILKSFEPLVEPLGSKSHRWIEVIIEEIAEEWEDRPRMKFA